MLVLSGDHIYKMDYSKMLAAHKKRGADCTIAVIEVPIEEASRFGIMTTDSENRITKFSEKPKNPDSTKASMGIYIFNKDKLFQYLCADEADPASSNDFGKNVIPAMLAAGEKMYAYPFRGYWKDVGTIRSLWEANMDMLGESPALALGDDRWRIYSRHDARAPHYVSAGAVVENSSITEGCEICGTVRGSVLGAGVKVMPGACVIDSVVMSDVTVKAGASVSYSIIDSGSVIGEGAVVGAPESTGAEITVVGSNVQVPAGGTVAPGAMLSAN